MRSVEEVLWALYGDDIPREQCPLRDSELRALQRISPFTKSKRLQAYEYGRIIRMEQIERANEDSKAP